MHSRAIRQHGSVFQTIWSLIAVAGAFAVCGMIAYFIAVGRHDREDEEAARVYFDEHGHWPDES